MAYIEGGVFILDISGLADVKAQKAEDKAAKLINDAGGKAVHEPALPGKPVIGVLMPPKFGDAELKALASFKSLFALTMTGPDVTDAALKDIKNVGPLGIVGFCMGGTIAFLAATRLSGLSAAVGYYGGRIVAFADEKPKCPVQLHFGEKDASIPMTDVDIIKQKRSQDCEIFVYNEAGHGFHCDERGSLHKGSADIAWKRTTEFFAKHMKK